MLRHRSATGLTALNLTTELLHRARLSDPAGGVWEAADVQWWWRRPRRSDRHPQRFWLDATGPLAGVILTDWGEAWGCDLIIVPGVDDDLRDLVWRTANAAIDAFDATTAQVLVRTDDVWLIERLEIGGFSPGPTSAIAWQPAIARPSVAEPPPGYEVVDRDKHPAGRHPLAARNDAVERRLRQCSLYDPALDLSAVTGAGEVAGYGLFWADDVTGVGLVEPFRVEDSHRRRGLGRALLTAGLERLALRGVTRLKIGYATGEAKALYEGAGFQTTTRLLTYTRSRV